MAHPMNAATVELEQAERNIAARNELIEEFGALTRRDLNATGVPMEAQLLAVSHHDRELFPRFQFDEEGRPLPVVADILTTLRSPHRVMDAATHEAEPRVF